MKHTDKPTTTASAPETRTFTCAYCSEPVRQNDGHPCDENRRKKYGYPPRFPKRTIPAEKPKYVATIAAKDVHRITDHTQQTSIKWAQRCGEMHGRIESLEGERDHYQAQAAQLAECLRDLLDVVERIGPPAITRGGLCEEQDWATATSKAGHRLQQWKANQ